MNDYPHEHDIRLALSEIAEQAPLTDERLSDGESVEWEDMFGELMVLQIVDNGAGYAMTAKYKFHGLKATMTL